MCIWRRSEGGVGRGLMCNQLHDDWDVQRKREWICAFTFLKILIIFFWTNVVFWIWTYVRFLDEHHVGFCTWGPRRPLFNEKVVRRCGRRCTHLRYHPHIEIWNISALKSTRNSRWLRGYPVNGLNTVNNNEIAAEHAKNSVQYTLQISNSNQLASYLSLDNSHHELQLRTAPHISWQVIIWISACRWWETQESLWSDSNASR